MDISQYRRSENVEDQRDWRKAILDLLVGTPKRAFDSLRNHPFQTNDEFYQQLYLKNNPQLDGSQLNNPLSQDLGIQSIPRTGVPYRQGVPYQQPIPGRTFGTLG